MEICEWCGSPVTEWISSMKPLYEYDGYAFCCRKCVEEYKSSQNDSDSESNQTISPPVAAPVNYGSCDYCGNTITGEYTYVGSYKFCSRACYLRYNKEFPDDLRQEAERAKAEKQKYEKHLEEINRENERIKSLEDKYNSIIEAELVTCNKGLNINPIPYLEWSDKLEINEYPFYFETKGIVRKQTYVSIGGAKNCKYRQAEVKFCSYINISRDIISEAIGKNLSETQFKDIVKQKILEEIASITKKRVGPDFCDLMKYQIYNRSDKRLGGDSSLEIGIYTGYPVYDQHVIKPKFPYKVFISPDDSNYFYIGGKYSGSGDGKTITQFNKTYQQFSAQYTNGSDTCIDSQSFLIKGMKVSWNNNQIKFSFDEISNVAFRASGSLKLCLYFFKKQFNGSNTSDGIFAGSCLLPIERKLLYPMDGWKNETFTAPVTGTIPDSGDFYPTVVITEHSNGNWSFTGTKTENVTTFSLMHFGNSTSKHSENESQIIQKEKTLPETKVVQQATEKKVGLQSVEAKALAEKKAAEEKEKAIAQAKLDELRKKGTEFSVTELPALTIGNHHVTIKFPKILNVSKFDSQRIVVSVYLTENKDIDFKTVELNNNDVLLYNPGTTITYSLKSSSKLENYACVVNRDTSAILYDKKYYFFAVLWEINYLDTSHMHEIKRFGLYEGTLSDFYYDVQRNKQKKKNLVKGLGFGILAAAALSFGIAKCKSGSASDSKSKTATNNSSTQTKTAKTEYVKGSLDYSWNNKFKMDGVSANWNYESKTVTFKVKELRNISEHPTGSLKIALFMSDQPFTGGTLYGKVAEHVISVSGLQPTYGWNDTEWETTFLSSAPLTSGDKYPVIAILEYATTKADETNWFICGNNYTTYNKTGWFPK